MFHRFETASSSNVKDTDEDTDEDESNHSIAKSFDKLSSENLDSESDCNIGNTTTELNCNEHIKLSVNVIEASYFNILECGRSVLDKMDVTYQSEFAASEKASPPAEWGPLKPSPPSATYTSTLKTPLKKIISALTGSKPSTLSPVKRAEYISPYKEKYWVVKTKILRKQMEGIKEAYILEVINKLRTENTEMHDGIIDYFVNQYDEYSQSSE